MTTATATTPKDRVVVEAFAEIREDKQVVYLAMTALHEAADALARAEVLIESAGLFKDRPFQPWLEAVGLDAPRLDERLELVRQHESELDDANSTTRALASEVREVWRLLEEDVCGELAAEVERRMAAGPHSN